jgi:hypothetical protein
MKRSKGCSSGAGGFALAAGLAAAAGAGAADFEPELAASFEGSGDAAGLALAADEAGEVSGPGLAGLELSVTGSRVGGCCDQL